MESFGEYLRKIRLEKKLEIDQIAQKTRIKPGFIQALESDRFDELPGETFAQGFIRSYARSLGLDEAETVERFKDASKDFFQKAKESRKSEIAETQKAVKRKTVFNALVQIGILVLIGIAVWVVSDMNSGEETLSEPDSMRSDFQGELLEEEPGMDLAGQDPDAVMAEDGVENPQEGEIPALTPLAEDASLSGEEAADPPPLIQPELPASINLPGLEKAVEPGGAELTLVIEALEPSWILARIDDEVTKEVFLQIGDTVKWTARNHFSVDFGNAGGVRVLLNDAELPSFGESGQVVKNVLLK